MDVLKVGGGEEEDETEVSLELSIGGSYGKSVEMEKGKKQRDPLLQTNVSRSDFSCNNNNNNCKRDLEKKRKVEDRGKDEISEGGSNADSGEIYSNSPDSRTNQCSSSRSNAVKRLREDHSKSQTQPSKPALHSIVAPSVLLTKPPKPPNHQAQGGPVQQMPCVTTTGNGPHGKTINGFLCKYTKNEVSIVCVCHRRLFSPSEFVEHAGGVDIANPLRHITIVNPVKR